MNSHQRRKDRKRWCYAVEPNYNLESWEWRQMDERYMAIFNWCKSQFGDNVERCGWRDRDAGRRWEFDCPKKAALFALRWSS